MTTRQEFVVYLSSTLADLEPEREVALKTIAEFARVATSYRASEEGVVTTCTGDVRKCNLYIGILGQRYGYVPPERNSEEKSITELEYEACRTPGQPTIPRLMFIKPTEAGIAAAHIDALSNPKSAERMKAFLDRAGKDQTLYLFKNLDDLRAELRIRVNEKAHQFHQVHVGNATGFSNGVSRLLEDTAVVGDGIRTTIAEKTPILRRELLEELCRLIEASPLVFVTGAAGFGKSALVKSAFTTATQGGIGFAFRAVSLAGHHINEVLHRFGLTLAALQAQTALYGRKVLWVDSLERLMEKPAEQRVAFLDLLRALKLDPTWRLVVTCRDYSAETVRTAFFTEAGLTPADVEVEGLSDDEIDGVAADFPLLQRPLTNPALRSLLRNPFFLDMAAKMNWLVTEPLTTTERAFREKVWREVISRVDEDVESGLPNLRGQVLVEVALRRAKALEPFVSAADLDPRALSRLARDSLLQTPAPGNDLYAPAHDVFEDWALMRWLEEEFDRHGRQLDSLVEALGTYPALRRAYRRWLTEFLDADPQTTDPSVLALIQNPNVAAHWREDTLVSVLQSGDALGFIHRNVALLLSGDARLLRQVIHILRVACRAAIPRRLLGVDSVGEFFLPKGNGWIGAGELMEAAIPLFTESDLLFIVAFLEDWVLLTKYGVRYPKGARSIAKIAWHWLPRITWRGRDAEDRLLRVILAIPLAAEPSLTTMVEATLAAGQQNRADDALLQLIFNHFACASVVRDLPDLAFRVAEHLLSLNRSLEEVVANHSGYSTEAVSYAFGLGTRFSMDDFPASAYHGPYLRMLWHHPSRGVDFIIRLINRACEAYAHPDNGYEYIEPPEVATIQLPDGIQEQYANDRLWGAYRGVSVAPECFQSALMALEYWLLEKAKSGDADLEAVLLDLLHRSNNVAITAVVASVAAAHPARAGQAAYALLTCRHLLTLDLHRSVQERFNSAQTGILGLSAIGAEQRLYDKERAESARLEHRGRSLEYVAVVLQTLDTFRDRVWALIDAYKADLPPELEQDRETKLWRIQLHRIDTRKFVETGRTEEGLVLIGSSEPESDLQELIEKERPRSAAFESAMGLLHWGRSAFEGRAINDNWPEQLLIAQAQVTAGPGSEHGHDLAAGGPPGGPPYVAAVCIRDHWWEMSPEQQEWCAQIVCDAIASDADATEHFSIVARNPMEGSRPAAFAVSALFDKALSSQTQMRLLPSLAKAVMHSVGETVSYAMLGVARFLWRSDRALALTCVQALVTQKLEKHAFRDRQRRRPFIEQESDEAYEADVRSRLREFIANRGIGNEAQIAALNLARWPARAVSQYLFIIATEQPNDPLARLLMQRCVVMLPTIWEMNESSRSSMSHSLGDEERYDSHIEHEFVKAICRYVLQLESGDALQLLEPVFVAARRFPEQAAGIVTWLILHQGDLAPAPTFWILWQRFADDFASGVQAARVDEEHSDEAKMLRELFLGANWNMQRDWLPLHGETQRLRALFERLPPMKQGFECYAYYLAKAGTPTLPDALLDVATKLTDSANHTLLSETAIFYLEEILTRLIYGGNTRVRTESALRLATLRILDALVNAGSSPAYKLRDDFLTPGPQ